MKKIVFLILTSSYITIAQNNIKSDTINKLKEIVVTYQAKKLTPVTFQNIEQSTIKSQSIGQEPALLLEKTPSMTSYSDGGYSQGYTYFRMRGMDQTRVNITLDGVPLNDPVDQGVFLSNYVDILNSVSKMQIQRGIGTSKNGTANYAGSIEMFSPELHTPKKFEFGIGSGSFNTVRIFGIFQSGLSSGKISARKDYQFKKALYARVSKMRSDGYKKHAANDAQSLFISGGLFFDKSTWKLNILSGSQKNELAWMGSSKEDIELDITNNGNSEFEKDDFSQTTIQIKNILFTNKNNTIESSLYYTSADGWWTFDYPNYATYYYNDANYQDYNSTTDDISTNSLTSNLIGFFSNYKIFTKNLIIITGMHGNTYKNDFSETHAYYQYQNTKYKNEISAFQKIELTLNKLLFFTDLQYRYTSFNYVGEVPFNEISWNFFNPKVGLSYQISEKTIAYSTIGKMGREPTKYDMFNGNDVLAYIAEIDTITNKYIEPELNTTPEQVVDYEVGIRHQNNKFKINLNYYYLDFENERVPTGLYGPSGFTLTSDSISQSIRTGIELFASFKINDQIQLINNSSYNHSQITQEDDLKFTPVLTPQFIINQEIIYRHTQNLSFGLSMRYQDKAYLNFENNKSLNQYTVFNGRINYKLEKFDVSIIVNNMTDNYYFNNGSIIDIRDVENGELINRERMYFVAPPRNYHIAIKYIF